MDFVLEVIPQICFERLMKVDRIKKRDCENKKNFAHSV